MKLETYLRDNDLRPSAFAERLNVAPSTITRLLKGERRPGPVLLKKIEQATDGAVQPNDFFSIGEVA